MFVTVMGPVVAVAGTTAFSDVADTNVLLVAATPLNLTALDELKPSPVRVTVVPAGPLAGENDVIPSVTV